MTGARAAVTMTLALLLPGASTPGCRGRGAADPIGLPDSYLLFVPSVGKDGQLRRGPTGLPVLEPLPLDDSRAVPLHKLFSLGFAAELLRTDYLRKQFVRDAKIDGRPAAPAALAAAAEPTIFVLASDPPFMPAGAGRGLATLGFFGGASERPDATWIAVPPAPDSDTALPQTVSARLAHGIAAAIAAGGATGGATAPGATAPGADASVLVEGYASAMEVIAREWRLGEGPRGTVAPDAGTVAQREIFAAVRQNRFVMTPDAGHPRLRSAVEMLHDPGVAATVIYRMAQSKGIGHRVAPSDVYAPFVSERVPQGISPAAVLGPMRNFQAKLISAWGRAVMRGTPPRDIVDLVEAYAASLPAERSEVIRLFVVTTFGATVKAGGVSMDGDGGGADSARGPDGARGPDSARGSHMSAELTALAAEVAAGRRPLRLALQADK